jgi:CheY-like chemotaxis protein
MLVIEDDAIMREALSDWLRAAGYGVRSAADGDAGLAAVKLTVPALVVTDIHMPGISGAAIISQLKRNYPQVAVIAISGMFSSGHGLDGDAALALGPSAPWPEPARQA